MHIEDTLNVYLRFIQEQEKNHSKKFQIINNRKIKSRILEQEVNWTETKQNTHTQTNEKTGQCIEANPILWEKFFF